MFAVFINGVSVADMRRAGTTDNILWRLTEAGGDFRNPKGEIKLAKLERPDRSGAHQTAFRKNKKIIYATQTICGICGQPVDMTLKYPHPLSKCVDHIIPVAKGGHPSDIDNLQLAHWTCNRQKSDKLIERSGIVLSDDDAIANDILPLSVNWKEYKHI